MNFCFESYIKKTFLLPENDLPQHYKLEYFFYDVCNEIVMNFMEYDVVTDF